MKKVLWLRGGEKHWNKEITDVIGTKIDQQDKIQKHTRLIRHLVGMMKTFNIFHKEKPDTVVLQNLSSDLAFNAVFCKYLFGYRLGLDTHKGEFTLESNSSLLNLATKFIQKHADFIIVHNKKSTHYLGDEHQIIVVADKIRRKKI